MSQIDEILDRAIQGQRLNLEDGIKLFESDELEKIGNAANKIKKRLHPENYVTFVIGRNINYSNICDTCCRFCAFYKKPGEEGGYILPTETILEKIKEMKEFGGTEVLMQGGNHPTLPFEFYINLLKDIKKEFPDVHMHSFSPSEIMKMKEVSGLSLEETLKQIHEAGLDSLPGAGAEILDDRTRNKISKLKISWQEWIEIMVTANNVGLPTTGTMVIGFGESMEERVLHLIRLRDAQDKSKGFSAFIPWIFQPDNTNMKAEKVSSEEYLKTVAISRLMLDNIPNIQASWVTVGAETGKKSLSFGANDFGSTMMEENVVSAAGTSNKINTNQILELIDETGYLPAQRNTKYEILHIFNKGERIQNDFVMKN